MTDGPEHTHDLGLVIQGPVYPFTEAAIKLFESFKSRRKLKVVLSTWTGQPVSSFLYQACDDVIFTDDPGPSLYNTQRQCVSTMAGLERLSENGIATSLKSRTDIAIKEQFIDALLDAGVQKRSIVVTNVFTRLHPLHLSDMVVCAPTDLLMDMFVLDPRTEQFASEERLCRNLMLRRFPSILDAEKEGVLDQAWAAFMQTNVTVWDFYATSMMWAKKPKIFQHQDYVFNPTAQIGAPDLALVVGTPPFSTPEALIQMRTLARPR